MTKARIECFYGTYEIYALEKFEEWYNANDDGCTKILGMQWTHQNEDSPFELEVLYVTTKGVEQ